jgi:lipopolysaccharide export system permease protein
VNQLDRYITSQLIGPFAFFLLVFTGILWLNQALRIIDLIVENNQSGLVFLELSVLLLPRILEVVVPVSAFAAAVFLTNRLYSESELVVMMGSGRGPVQLIRPFFIFGMGSFLLMSLVTHFLIPLAVGRMQDRRLEIQREFIAQIIVEGEFVSPGDGITFFFGSTAASGELRDILINDASNPSVTVTHTARKGQIVQGDDGPKLVLFEGLIQQYSAADKNLSTVEFDTLSYDLTQFAKNVTKRRTMLSERPTSEVIRRGSDTMKADPGQSGAFLAEGHGRIVKALLSLIVPVMGAAVLMAGSFQRTGFFFRIALAIGIMVALNSLTGLTQSRVIAAPDKWPILYLPPLLGLVIAGLLLWVGTGRWRLYLKRRPPTTGLAQ